MGEGFGDRNVEPAEGERSAVSGFANQYALAAAVVVPQIPTLEWIRVADPAAGVADDFQFLSGGCRHGLQVKWSVFSSSFQWSEFANTTASRVALFRQMADAWSRIRGDWDGDLLLHLCTNDSASTADPSDNSVLGRSAVSHGPKHFAAFLTRSFFPVQASLRAAGRSWSDVREEPVVSEWQSVWDHLLDVSGLSEADFVRFLRELELSFMANLDLNLIPAPGADSGDLRKFAALVQGLVAAPDRPIELGREDLLARLGWSERVRFRNPHRFPVPQSYAANAAARSALEQQLGRLSGGYLALVAPAGSGKSTLLESIDFPGRTVRYYAFLPDAPDPLSARGEAESFFHDISYGLEKRGFYRSGFGNDLRSQRQVLFDQLAAAGERHTSDGVATIIVIDGLDHVAREQRPSRSFLLELPPPTAVPDGVFVVLGSQTLDIVSEVVQAALALDGRCVELPPLAADEARQVVEQSEAAEWLYPGQIDRVVSASERHPLALTYVLRDLDALIAETDVDARRLMADEVLRDASRYGADIAERYRGYLAAIGDEPELRGLLGVVARLRAPLSVDWLKAWNSALVVDRFVGRTGTFFRKRGDEWRFVHNSFRQFLADETARVAGQVDASRDRALHAELADLCAASGELSPYRDEELAHRFLAGDHVGVLAAATPSRLRDALRACSPIASVRTHAALALRAAAELDDHRGLVRMLMFVSELAQREYTFEPKVLAEAVAKIDAARVVPHLIAGGSLQSKYTDALNVAADLARNGSMDDAGQIVAAVGGLAGLRSELGEGPLHARDWIASIGDWAEVTCYRFGVARVLEELEHVLPRPASAEWDGVDKADLDRDARDRLDRARAVMGARSKAFASCFDVMVGVRDAATLEVLTETIDREGSLAWRARARCVRVEAAVSDGDAVRALVHVREMLALTDGAGPDGGRLTARLPLQLRLSAAKGLLRLGLDDAAEIDELVPAGTSRKRRSNVIRDDFDEYVEQVVLDSVRWAHRSSATAEDVTLESLAEGGSTRDAGERRLYRALAALARIEGDALISASDGVRVEVAANSAQIVRLLEVSSAQSRDWSGWYFVRGCAPDLFRRLVRLSASVGGAEDLRALLNQFETAWVSAERAHYWSTETQVAIVVAAVEANPEEASWARRQLDRVEDVLPHAVLDPHGRASNWRVLAEGWAALGDRERAFDALARAVDGSWGHGLHHDDGQIALWLAWLGEASARGRLSDDEFVAELRDYAGRLLVDSLDRDYHLSEAAEEVVRLSFGVHPAMACALAEEFCEGQVVDEATCVASVSAGAATDESVDLKLAVLIQTEMAMPLAPRVSADAVTALERRDASGDVAGSLIRARKLWTLFDDDRERPRELAGLRDQVIAEPDGTDSFVSWPALLTALRESGQLVAPETLRVWECTALTLPGQPGRQVARALAEQAERLRLSGRLLGALCRLAADAGDTEIAERVLSSALARSRASGWFVHIDGGTRLQLFREALLTGNAHLRRLAARDVANAVHTESISGQISPSDLRRIAEVVGGSDLVADCWPDVRAYLDVFAAVGDAVPVVDPPQVPAVTAFIAWVADYLGHPVRPLDFGARAVLEAALDIYPAETARILADQIASGGWPAEAALTVVASASEVFDVAGSPDLRRNVEDAAVGPDALLRAIAARVLSRSSLPVPLPTPTSLPVAYGLETPALYDRAMPELDGSGVPFLDPNDPRQHVAPSDILFSMIAEVGNLDEATVMRRGASFAAADRGRWLRGGHRASAERLKRRGNPHIYRPWAYMAGRRALGRVLAEVVDAGRVELNPTWAAYEVGAIDETLGHIRPEPIDESMPAPWRPDDARDYDTGNWAAETVPAAEAYIDMYKIAPNYVLGELSDWVNFDWKRPGEQRLLSTAHDGCRHDVTDPRRRPRTWEVGPSAGEYLSFDYSRRAGQRLVVDGREHYTDGVWHEWLALHPSVGEALGWHPADDNVFGWDGDDGDWRARTELHVRGLLSHDPPLRTFGALVWRVVISGTGLAELRDGFPGLERILRVTRFENSARRDDDPDTSRMAVVRVPEENQGS